MSQKIVVTEGQFSNLINEYLDEAGSRKQRSILNYTNKQQQANKPKPPAEEEPAQIDTSNTTAEPKPAEEPAQQEPVDTQSQSSKNAGAPINTTTDNSALQQAAGSLNSIEQILKRWGLNPQTSKKCEVAFLNDIQDVIYDENMQRFVKAFDDNGTPIYLLRRGYKHIGIFDTTTLNGVCDSINGDKSKKLSFNYKGNLSGGTNNTIVITNIKYSNGDFKKIQNQEKKNKVKNTNYKKLDSTILTREVSQTEQRDKIESLKGQFKNNVAVRTILGKLESEYTSGNRAFNQDIMMNDLNVQIKKLNADKSIENNQIGYDKELSVLTNTLSRPLLTIKLQVIRTYSDSKI